jgi:hypothetical protein
MRYTLRTFTFLIALAGSAAFANESVVITPGMVSTLQVPAVAPFTTLGSTRLEFRLTQWVMPAYSATVFRNTGFSVQLRSSGELCAADIIDAPGAYDRWMCADITGHPDVSVRVQRDTTAAVLRYQVQSTDATWTATPYCGSKQSGTSSQTFPCPLASVNSGSWAGTGALGDPQTNVQVAWMKWFSTVVPDGSGALAEFIPADLADWRFEGNLQNQATGNYPVSLGSLSLPAASAAGAGGYVGLAYAPSPMYAPVCRAGSAQVLHTAQSGQLDGSGSYPVDGGSFLTFAWSQGAGPASTSWSSRTATQPSITAPTPGAYVFQLTVTDGSGLSSVCTVADAVVSITQSAAGTASVTLPATSPWTTIGAANNAMRWEMRLHGFAATWPVRGIDLGPISLWQQSPTMIWAESNFNADTIYNNGSLIQGCCSGRTDVLIRVQRDVVNQQYTFEVCDTTGGNCQSSSSPIVTFGPLSWAGMTVSLNGGYQTAFLRWFSSVVPVGTPIPIVGASGDLADWEFEGSLNDSSTHALTMTGSAAFTSTPVYSPSCNAGVQQTFRAGYPAVLNGSGSSPLDGGASLQYSWQQVSGPSTVAWSNATTAQPTVQGLVFGSYVFQLTATDLSGQPASCTVKHGAVATDNNGVVITGNAMLDQLLGPMMRFGANPWPWYDDRHKALSDMQITNLNAPEYAAYFDVAAPGTVSVSAGSSTVVGYGTSFTTTFCQGPGNPTVPQANAAITVWYPTGIAGQTGRRMQIVLSCQSDTLLTMGNYGAPIAWSGVPDGAGARLQYSSATSFWYYALQGPPQAINYYDNVAGLYALYYRSGIDTYRDAARTLADRVWRSPEMDRGASCGLATGNGFCFWPNAIGMLGMVLRASDNPPADMWQGMHSIWDMERYLIDTFYPEQTTPGTGDTRAMAFDLTGIAYCARYDTDATYRANCQSSLSNAISGYFTQRKTVDANGVTGWQMFYSNDGSMWGSPTTVTLSNGSTAVTGNGTAWTSGITGGNFWFFAGTAQPADNAAGDAGWYSVTFVDPTHLTLNRPYQDPACTPSCAKGWAYSPDLLGYGAQPFMESILGAAFDWTAKALAAVDPVNSALARTYNIAAANWVKTYGYQQTQKGPYYGALFVNCPAPIADGTPYCTAAATDAVRSMSAEAWRGLQAAYAATSDSSLKSWLDEMFNAMFAKPGTCPSGSTTCVSDGQYVDPIDNGGYMVPATLPPPKWYGAFFGYGDTEAWPGFRIGGVQQIVVQGKAVPVDFASVPGAVKARLKATAPSGETVETECSSSPCTVNVDRRQGEYLVDIQYLSRDGKVLK